MAPLSSNAQLSLHVLEGDVPKIEYNDYLIRTPNQQKDTEPMVRPVASQQNAAGSFDEETAGTTYFRVQPNGKLEHVTGKELEGNIRERPDLSSQLLSVEELEELEPEKAVQMCIELFASHGLVFEEEMHRL
jgi:hypothetical protein